MPGFYWWQGFLSVAGYGAVTSIDQNFVRIVFYYLEEEKISLKKAFFVAMLLSQILFCRYLVNLFTDRNTLMYDVPMIQVCTRGKTNLLPAIPVRENYIYFT